MGLDHCHGSHRMPPAGGRGNTSKALQRRPSRISPLVVTLELSPLEGKSESRGREGHHSPPKLRPRSPLQHVEQSLIFFLSEGWVQKSCRLLFLKIPTEQCFPLVLKLGGREEFI